MQFVLFWFIYSSTLGISFSGSANFDSGRTCEQAKETIIDEMSGKFIVLVRCTPK